MLSMVSACLWALAATAVALLPMRRQYIPGVTLLILAPILIIWLSVDHGWWVGVLACLGFVSMFRHPLRYFIKKALSKHVEFPKELREAPK